MRKISHQHALPQFHDETVFDVTNDYYAWHFPILSLVFFVTEGRFCCSTVQQIGPTRPIESAHRAARHDTDSSVVPRPTQTEDGPLHPNPAIFSLPTQSTSITPSPFSPLTFSPSPLYLPSPIISSSSSAPHLGPLLHPLPLGPLTPPRCRLPLCVHRHLSAPDLDAEVEWLSSCPPQCLPR